MGKVTVVGGKIGMEVPSNLPPVGTSLDNCTWEEISNIAAVGLASNYWHVGDSKNITINGTVNRTTFNVTMAVFILGFNHNASVEGSNRIHFMLGKIDSTHVALVDNYYAQQSNNGFCMNTSGTNSGTNMGGWSSSFGRNTLLGNSGTPASPPSNSLIAALPSDLRAVMKPVTKYTDNTAYGSNNSSVVTSTVDYLFFLAEYEIRGSRGMANSYEQNYQAQYDFYKAGNSMIRYKHNAIGTACYWWCRSASSEHTEYFLACSEAGGFSAAKARNCYAIAPAFCV